MGGPEPVGAELGENGRAVVITWSDGLVERLPSAWLSDNVDAAFDLQTGQRRLGLAQLDFESTISGVALTPAGLTLSLGDRKGLVARLRLRSRRRERPENTFWLNPQPIESLPSIRASAFIQDDAALAEAAFRVSRYGLAFLTGGRTEPGYVEKLVDRFGFVRPTNYGRIFDVRSEPRPSNLAYTAEALDLHTDNPYRDPPPPLQLLHAIRADSRAGATHFVDGFAHARALAEADPQAFDVLVGEPVEFAFSAPDGGVYRARRPLIEQGPDGEILAVRLNHRSLAPLELAADKLAGWYEAYRAFHLRLHATGAALEIRLQPGDVALFDNRRVLHGRGAFDGRAATARWLQGCYADIDGLMATLTRLRPGTCA